ncbi:MAG: zinc-ribbon domain-containing protein, partial [Ktedonobacteraceae bacterium]
MMFCAKCGASNPSESIFCGGCGSSLTLMQDAQPAMALSSEQVPAATSPLQASTPTPASGEAPTLLIPVEQPFVQPQPTPILNMGAPSQGMPAPALGTPSDVYQEQAPTVFAASSGANYPPQGAAMPMYASGANYPPQGAVMPMYASGANYPPQGAAMPTYASGANYPPQGAVMPMYASGANYPPQS